ncbi:hypothetical protein quinque_015078 [Culex quinquefasciatus]
MSADHQPVHQNIPYVTNNAIRTNSSDPPGTWNCERNASRCKLEVIVNYGEPGLEFAVHFDCATKPIFNQHSRNVFRNVKRYRLEGDEVNRDGLGLEYLHFPEQVEILVLADYCLARIDDDAFGNHFEHLQEVILSGNQLHELLPELFVPSIDLIVDDNPWDCVWLLQLIQQHPQYFAQLKYHQIHYGLTVRGLPCMVHLAISTSTSSTEPLPLSTLPTILRHPVQTYPTVTIVEPFNVPSKLKIILATVVTGLFVSHSILLLYNRYKRLHHEPFYRRLPKEDQLARFTITTRTNSFLYEAPAPEVQETALLRHIYEELPERRTEECYDHLQFHRLEVEEDVVDV